MKVRVFFLVMVTIYLSVFFPGCVYHSKVYPDAEWHEKLPEKAGVSQSGLDEAIDFLRLNSGCDGVEELAIIRNGYLFLRQGKWNGDHRRDV